MNWYKKAFGNAPAQNVPATSVPSVGGYVPPVADQAKVIAELKANIQNTIIPAVADQIIPQLNNLLMTAKSAISKGAGPVLPPALVDQLSFAIISTWTQQAAQGNEAQAAGMVSTSDMVSNILNSMTA